MSDDTGRTNPPSIIVTTRTGLEVLLRQARPDDGAALRVGFEHLSSDSRYTRFFTAVPRLSGALLHQLTDLDGQTHLAIAAFDPSRPSEVLTDDGALPPPRNDGFGIAVARVIQPDPDIPTAELAVAIIDEYHGVGLGHILMAALIVLAESRHIERLQAFVLATNVAMIHLLQRYGAAEIHLEPHDPGVRTFELKIGLAAGADSALERAGGDPELVARLRTLT